MAIATTPVTFAAVPVVFWLSVGICVNDNSPEVVNCGTRLAVAAVVKHPSCAVVNPDKAVVARTVTRPLVSTVIVGTIVLLPIAVLVAAPCCVPAAIFSC